MRRSDRLGSRKINYKIFHSTGKKVNKRIEQQGIASQSTDGISELLSLFDDCSIEDSTMSKTGNMANQLLVEESVDENPVQRFM